MLLAACADGPDAAEDDAAEGGTAGEANEAAADDPAAPETADTPDEPEATAPAEEPGAVSELLAFRAETVGGEQFDGAELAGEPTALRFWAPW
jgi:hypothetical protein